MAMHQTINLDIIICIQTVRLLFTMARHLRSSLEFQLALLNLQTAVLFMTSSLRTKLPFHEKFRCMAV